MALPPNDRTMWRKLLAKVHPDAGGTGELFIWPGSVKDVVCGGELHIEPGRRAQPPPASAGTPAPEENPRVPYADGDSAAFEAGTDEARRMAGELGTDTVYGALLAAAAECKASAEYAYREERGASYRQLAAIGHTVGMGKADRAGWYRVAESVPLSDAHAGHILGRLKRQAA